jgi:hypothetical protein
MGAYVDELSQLAARTMCAQHFGLLARQTLPNACSVDGSPPLRL